MGTFFQQAGRFVQWLLNYGGAYVGLFLEALDHAPKLLREPARRLLLKQVYFTGIETLPLLTVVGLVTGYASATALYGVLLQDMGLTLDVFRAVVIREASLLLVAFYILARSGSAIASELASMKQNGELATLYSLGIDPVAYLVTPRIAALVLCTTALSIYFQVTAIYGGFALMSIFSNWDYMLAVAKFNDGLEVGAIVRIVAKSLVFGGIIGAVCCQQGLAAPPGPFGIPGATRAAMIHSFTAIVLGAGIFVALFG